MNTETSPQPVEHLMKRFVNDAESMVKDEPAKAIAVAMGLGLVLNVLPTRFLVSSMTAVTLTVLRPALLSLGVVKAFELCHSSPKIETLP